MDNIDHFSREPVCAEFGLTPDFTLADGMDAEKRKAAQLEYMATRKAQMEKAKGDDLGSLPRLTKPAVEEQVEEEPTKKLVDENENDKREATSSHAHAATPPSSPPPYEKTALNEVSNLLSPSMFDRIPPSSHSNFQKVLARGLFNLRKG